MRIRSLGLSSDLAMLNCEILDRGSYLAVRSPEEPSFYWGNLLIFAQPPKQGDLERWEALFASEFRDLPEVLHQTFIWDMTEEASETAAFADKGYQVEHSVVLTASALNPPPHANSEVQVRALQSEEDFLALVELQVICRDEEHEEAHYRGFVEGRLRGYRKRIDAKEGEWYSAFVGDQQVATLGIFRSGRSARFQTVMTHPDFRRKGICGTLVHQVAEKTLARNEIESLIMLADTEYHAARIYESLGFAPTETLEGLCRWPD